MTFIINVSRLICGVGDPVRQFQSTVTEREGGRERERGEKRKEEEVLQTAVSCDHKVHLLGFAFLHFD